MSKFAFSGYARLLSRYFVLRVMLPLKVCAEILALPEPIVKVSSLPGGVLPSVSTPIHDQPGQSALLGAVKWWALHGETPALP